ncbi:cytidine deaminase, partial [Streptomyces bottropensis]
PRAREAGAVDPPPDTDSLVDRAAVRDLGGPKTPVLLAGPDGSVRTTLTAG